MYLNPNWIWTLSLLRLQGHHTSTVTKPEHKLNDLTLRLMQSYIVSLCTGRRGRTATLVSQICPRLNNLRKHFKGYDETSFLTQELREEIKSLPHSSLVTVKCSTRGCGKSLTGGIWKRTRGGDFARSLLPFATDGNFAGFGFSITVRWVLLTFLYIGWRCLQQLPVFLQDVMASPTFFCCRWWFCKLLFPSNLYFASSSMSEAAVVISSQVLSTTQNQADADEKMIKRRFDQNNIYVSLVRANRISSDLHWAPLRGTRSTNEDHDGAAGKDWFKIDLMWLSQSWGWYIQLNQVNVFYQFLGREMAFWSNWNTTSTCTLSTKWKVAPAPGGFCCCCNA